MMRVQTPENRNPAQVLITTMDVAITHPVPQKTTKSPHRLKPCFLVIIILNSLNSPSSLIIILTTTPTCSQRACKRAGGEPRRMPGLQIMVTALGTKQIQKKAHPKRASEDFFQQAGGNALHETHPSLCSLTCTIQEKPNLVMLFRILQPFAVLDSCRQTECLAFLNIATFCCFGLVQAD